MLEPSTSNGDFVDLGMNGMYKVIRVRFLYKFTDGKHRVYKKKLDVVKSRPSWINGVNGEGESEASSYIMGEFLQ